MLCKYDFVSVHDCYGNIVLIKTSTIKRIEQYGDKSIIYDDNNSFTVMESCDVLKRMLTEGW